MQKDELLITASLARLELYESEIDRLDIAVSGMIEYFSVMDEIDVDDLEPAAHTFVKENRTKGWSGEYCNRKSTSRCPQLIPGNGLL